MRNTVLKRTSDTEVGTHHSWIVANCLNILSGSLRTYVKLIKTRIYTQLFIHTKTSSTRGNSAVRCEGGEFASDTKTLTNHMALLLTNYELDHRLPSTERKTAIGSDIAWDDLKVLITAHIYCLLYYRIHKN